MTLSKGGSRYSRKHHSKKHRAGKHHSKKHRAGKHRTRKHHSRKHRRSAHIGGTRPMDSGPDGVRRSTRRAKPSLKARENDPEKAKLYKSIAREEREEKEQRRALLRATKKTKKPHTTKKKTGNPQGLSKATKAKIVAAFKADPYALQEHFPDTKPAIPRGDSSARVTKPKEPNELDTLTRIMGDASFASHDPTMALANMMGRISVSGKKTSNPGSKGAPAPGSSF